MTYQQEVERLQRVLHDPSRRRSGVYLCGGGSRIHINGATFYTAFFYSYLRRRDLTSQLSKLADAAGAAAGECLMGSSARAHNQGQQQAYLRVLNFLLEG